MIDFLNFNLIVMFVLRESSFIKLRHWKLRERGLNFCYSISSASHSVESLFPYVERGLRDLALVLVYIALLFLDPLFRIVNIEFAITPCLLHAVLSLNYGVSTNFILIFAIHDCLWDWFFRVLVDWKVLIRVWILC